MGFEEFIKFVIKTSNFIKKKSSNPILMYITSYNTSILMQEKISSITFMAL